MGSCIHMYYSRSAFGKADKKYIAFESILCILEIARMRQTVRILTTGEYVPQYLSPHCCMPRGHINEIYAPSALHTVLVSV